MRPEEFASRYMAHMNEQQRAAVCAVDAPTLLLAVPGSGKTTVLVTRLGYLIYCCGVAPSGILTMTYTQAATEEMRQRFIAFFGPEFASALKFSTINSVSLQIIYHYGRKIGRDAFELLEDSAIKPLLGDIYRQVNNEFATPSILADMRTAVSYVKNQMLSAQEVSDAEWKIHGFPEIYERYCAALRSSRKMDFDDQMVYAKTILETNPDVLQFFRNRYPYLCVDESQDTSRIQHTIIRMLTSGGRIFMVGDEDQSIYGFRAAYPDALMHFEQDYPGGKVLLMEENFRSTPEILEAANGFIQMNLYRRAKSIRPTRIGGTAVQIIYAQERETQYDYLMEAAKNATASTGILYRNNDSVLPLLDMLADAGIPYACRQMDDTFFHHRVITDIADIACFAWEPENTTLFRNIYYKLGCSISKAAAMEACRQSEESGKPVLVELLRQEDLPKYVRESVMELMNGLLLLQKDNALDGLSRIWNAFGYEKYVKERGLDKSKYKILRILARRQLDLRSLFQRMAQLCSMVERPHRDAGCRLVLSTIHSSKGLEYDTVYLLDVLDGVLPANANPGEKEESQQVYQEERRLFYVAMTRAKNRLYLFDCFDSDSSFVTEIKHQLPMIVKDDDDIFTSIRGNFCGRSYCHRENGLGVILANCELACLVSYENGKNQLLSLGDMLTMRNPKRAKVKPVRKTESQGKTVKKEQKKSVLKIIDGKMIKHMAKAGKAVHHRSFGYGVIQQWKEPYVTILFTEDNKVRTFTLVDAVQKGQLKLL